MDELEKRFTDPKPFSSSPPENRILDQIDKERLAYVNNMVQLLSQLNGHIMHAATEISIEDITPGDKVVIHSTSDIRVDGQEVTVMGKYSHDMVIILFSRAPVGYDPAIVISKHCLRLLAN